MNLRDLKYLVARADHKHFGRAAAASFVSQPTLSTQIRKLEDELGIALVERAPRKVMLTPAGRDIAWTYPDPLHDAAWVQDRLCFYSERADLTVDGVTHARPVTPWSSPADQERF